VLPEFAVRSVAPTMLRPHLLRAGEKNGWILRESIRQVGAIPAQRERKMLASFG
jgi:hypothetical protein